MRDQFTLTGDVAAGGVALLTGKSPVPEIKAKQFRYEHQKFEVAGLTPTPSETVAPMRAAECPVRWRRA